MSTNQPGPQLQWSIEQFLYQEARLLDEGRLEEWLDLFAEDATYFMPTRVNKLSRDRRAQDPNRRMPIFQDAKADMRLRIARLRTGLAWSEDPPSRTRHLVSNVEVEPGDDGRIRVRSCFVVFVSRMDEELATFSGVRNDVISSSADGTFWQIHAREIVGDQSVFSTNNLNVFF